MFAKKFRVKLDITGLVDAVDVSKTSSNGEVWGDRGERLVNGENIFRLGVEGVVINIFVVDTILLAASNADFLESIVR